GPSIWSGRGTLGEVLDGAFVLYTAKSLHHYYALDRDEPVLLTMVDKDGTVPPNNYVDPGFRVGPPIPADARSRCEALLSSSKPVEILQALTWLNGRHQDNQGWQELRKRPSVERRIRELTSEDSPEISTTA